MIRFALGSTNGNLREGNIDLVRHVTTTTHITETRQRCVFSKHEGKLSMHRVGLVNDA